MKKVASNSFGRMNAKPGNENVSTEERTQKLCAAEDSSDQNIDEPAKLNSQFLTSWNSGETAQSTNERNIGVFTSQIDDQTIQQHMQALDAGDADAMYQLARWCIDSSISDNFVKQISQNKTFKAKASELAKNYALGLAEPDNDQTAYLVMKRVEEENDLDVLCALGRACDYGWGVERDIQMAFEYYTRAADLGSSEAVERINDFSVRHVIRPIKAAFKHFKQLAAKGDAIAQYNTAMCYLFGLAVERDDDVLHVYLNKAASSGCANAITQLGIFHESESGAAESDIKAVQLYKQAADMGNTEAQFRLAQCYKDGRGVANDCEQAVFWYDKAVREGNQEAARWLSVFYERGCGVKTSNIKAFQCLKQAAIAGYSDAQYDVGICYYYGRKVSKSLQKAFYWIKKADAQANDAAMDFIHMYGREMRRLRKLQDQYSCPAALEVIYGIEEQHGFSAANAGKRGFRCEIAFLLAQLAAACQCVRAYSLVGDCYYYAIYVKKDWDAAARSYKRAGAADLAVLARLLHCNAMGETFWGEVSAFAVLRQINAVLRSEIDAALEQMR